MNTMRRGLVTVTRQRPSRYLCLRCYTTKPDTGSTTHFGFRTIPSEKKEEMGTTSHSPTPHSKFTNVFYSVGDVFSSVAKKYDTMNDIMSLYTHRLWKDYFVRTLNPGTPNSSDGMQILDVAGGTGDIAFRILEHATHLNNDTTAKVRVIDINEKMLKFGKRKVEKGDMRKWDGRVEFTQGNAETLEDVMDNSVDLYTIAFGIRNVTNIDKVLNSAYRVLKPGGVFACLVRPLIPIPIPMRVK